MEPRSNALLEAVFGHQKTSTNELKKQGPINTSGLSEDALLKTLELKIEQERTKQQYYKLENINRSMELFKLAHSAGMPMDQITSLYGPDIRSSKATNNSVSMDMTEDEDREPSTPAALELPKLHTRINSLGSNYSFPPNVGTSYTNHKRANSPARIGANAVAALSDAAIIMKEEENDADKVPKNSVSRTLPQVAFKTSISKHSRNLSLPVNTSNLPPAKHSDVCNYPINQQTEKLPQAMIPSKMTSILNFQGQEPEEGRSISSVASYSRRQISKRSHRKSRSASSFGVIDLNVIQEAEKESLKPKLVAMNPNLVDGRKNFPGSISSPMKTPTRNADDDTCSETSSRRQSPAGINRQSEMSSVHHLLNKT